MRPDRFDTRIPGNGDHGDGVVVELVVSDGTLDSGPKPPRARTVVTPRRPLRSRSTRRPRDSAFHSHRVRQDGASERASRTSLVAAERRSEAPVTTTETTDRYDLSVKGQRRQGDVITRNRHGDRRIINFPRQRGSARGSQPLVAHSRSIPAVLSRMCRVRRRGSRDRATSARRLALI